MNRKRWYVGVVGLLALPVMAASVAYACAALKTLSVSPESGDVGTLVKGFGYGFSDPHGANAKYTSPVRVYFGSTRNQVQTVPSNPVPDAKGVVAFEFRVPQMGPGSYAVIASQTDAAGNESPGGTAKASFTVNPPPAAPVTQSGASPEQRPATAQAAVGTAARPAPGTATAATPAGQPAPAGATAAAGAPAGAPAPAPVGAPTAQVGGVQAPAPSGAPAALGQPLGDRSARVGNESKSPSLALALVGAGALMTLVATGLVLFGRREEAAPAVLRRRGR
ncbi:MAG TPA: hypothetical protein VK988_18460 [Acidimicrobiales bacterium]|nr:hypothetical protein [Acidimicrobiales bacterium]